MYINTYPVKLVSCHFLAVVCIYKLTPGLCISRCLLSQYDISDSQNWQVPVASFSHMKQVIAMLSRILYWI